MHEPEEMTMTEHAPLVASNSPVGGLNKEMSVQDILDQAKFSVVDLMYLIALGIIAIADSMQACYIAIVLPTLTCDWSLNAGQQALVTSLTLMGTGIGGIFIGPLSDRFGRKPAAMVTSFILFLSMLVTAAATNVYYLMAFSILSGVCIGGSLSIAYTYWAEVSSRAHRTTGILVITMFWNSGILVSNGLGFLALNHIGWRSFTCIMAFPAIIPVIMLAFLHESPKYLNEMDRKEKLMDALRQKLRGTHTSFNIEDITIQKESQAPSDNWGIFRQSFATICGGELRSDTLKILATYSCLQVDIKGLLYIVIAIFATNFCGVKEASWVPTDDPIYDQELDAECAALSNGDLINGMLLSLSLYVSTMLTIILTKKLGELWSLKIFAAAGLFFNVLMLFCLPIPIMFMNMALMIAIVSGMSLVFYIILPEVYPTVARNSGFGLVDGVHKLVASVAIFVITAVLNYSVRSAIWLLIGITVILNIQVLVLGPTIRRQQDDTGDFSESPPHID